MISFFFYPSFDRKKHTFCVHLKYVSSTGRALRLNVAIYTPVCVCVWLCQFFVSVIRKNEILYKLHVFHIVLFSFTRFHTICLMNSVRSQFPLSLNVIFIRCDSKNYPRKWFFFNVDAFVHHWLHTKHFFFLCVFYFMTSFVLSALHCMVSPSARRCGEFISISPSVDFQKNERKICNNISWIAYQSIVVGFSLKLLCVCSAFSHICAAIAVWFIYCHFISMFISSHNFQRKNSRFVCYSTCDPVHSLSKNCHFIIVRFTYWWRRQCCWFKRIENTEERERNAKGNITITNQNGSNIDFYIVPIFWKTMIHTHCMLHY